MSVYKPSNSRIWQFDFIIKSRRYYGSTGVLNKRAAEEVERKKRQEAAMGKFGQVAEMTLDAACGRYWTEKGQYRGDADDVERRLDGLLILFGKRTKLGEIGQTEVAGAILKRAGMPYVKARDREGMKVRGAKEYAVSDSTVNRDVIDTLRPVLRRARSHWTPTGTPHGLPEIDWREIRLTEPRALNRVYSVAEQASWLAEAAAIGDDMDLALDLILINGLRYNELFFPLDAPKLDDEGKPVLGIQKGRKRDVILWVPLKLEHYRRIMAKVAMARAEGLEHIWGYRQGRKLLAFTYYQIEYRLSKAADAANISGGRRIHGGRHHAGSVTLRKTGGNLKAVQAMLGHADISSTQRYAHVDIGTLRAAIDDEVPRNTPEADLPPDLKSQLG